MINVRYGSFICGADSGSVQLRCGKKPEERLTLELCLGRGKTGEKLKTNVYIYEDKSGFQVADDSRLGAGDPTYVNVEFKKETNKKTQQLIAYLLAESPAGVLTNN